MDFLPPNSVHLVVTSPPYWTLKDYNPGDGQMGEIEDYEAFLAELDRVWRACFDALVPGGRPWDVCVKDPPGVVLKRGTIRTPSEGTSPSPRRGLRDIRWQDAGF